MEKTESREYIVQWPKAKIRGWKSQSTSQEIWPLIVRIQQGDRLDRILSLKKIIQTLCEELTERKKDTKD